jgi:YihY family inner membrane protein
VSTANPVPETRDLDGDDARRTLRDCGHAQLVRDAFIRLRVADGFSHARSLAYATGLLLVQGIISMVGLATALGNGEVSKVIVRTFQSAVPGPAGRFLTEATTQAHDAGAAHRYAGLIFGLVGALISGSTLFGQLERGFNRLYGVEQDRPSVRKYSLALLFTVTAGSLVAIAFAALALGRTIGNSFENHALDTAWAVLRWPLALVLLTVAITFLLRYSPRRRQPRLSWLAFGAAVSVALWTLSTIGLGLFLSASKSFGNTYGPLAGLVALQLWAFFSAVSLLMGGAVAAQLEALRAGESRPQDAQKVAHSEPEQQPTSTLAGAKA